MTERELFELWYIANHHDGDIYPNQQLLEWSEKGGFYFASSVEDLWGAWQAATQREGFKFVPVDASESMLDAGLNCEHDIDDFVVIDEIYKAMIGAVDE